MKRLVLLGGGHAHVHCLSSFAADPPPGTQVTLVTPHPRQIYSGMLPGWIAGHYALDECVIPLTPLAARAGIVFCRTSACGIDPHRRVVRCEDGSEYPYDVLSIDTGPVADLDRLPGAREHGLPVRPIEEFVLAWSALRERLRAAGSGRIVMVGAGAAGVELALAMRYSLREFPRVRFTLLSAASTLPGRSGARIERLMRRAGIEIMAGATAIRIESARVALAGGAAIDADAAIVSTGAAPAQWLQQSGLALDERGFLLTDLHMRVPSHARVFAAGDCASINDSPRPKSGVYAVRAGPPLAENLRRALAGTPLRTYAPQRRALYLLSTGGRHAVASWGPFSWEGAWVWCWKDRIDRAFVAKYSTAA